MTKSVGTASNPSWTDDMDGRRLEQTVFSHSNGCPLVSVFTWDVTIILQKFWPFMRKPALTAFRFKTEIHLEAVLKKFASIWATWVIWSKKNCILSNALITSAIETSNYLNDLLTYLVKTSSIQLTHSIKRSNPWNNLLTRLVKTSNCSNDLLTSSLEYPSIQTV